MIRFLIFLGLAYAGPSLSAAEIRFATQAEATAVLTETDSGYFDYMSEADPTIRLLSEEPKTVADLRAVYADAVRDFTPVETRLLNHILTNEADKLEALAPWLPETVLMIAATDKVEGGLPHTRANAIVFPPNSLTNANPTATDLFYHELFHVLSRNIQDRHDTLYGLINFTRCASIDIPPPFDGRVITNPDAPVNNYWVPVEQDGAQIAVIPLLYAVSTRFQSPRRGPPSFASQFRVGFLQVDPEDNCRAVRGRDGAPAVHRTSQIDKLFDAIGANTNYIIHPEEILASNFALMMTGNSVRDPWVLERLADFLDLPDTVLGGPALAD